MATELKPRAIKISDEMWSRWQAEAKGAAVSLTALIVQRMDGGQAEHPDRSAVPALHRQIEELNFTGDKMREEIATLKKALATAKATRPAKGIDAETGGQLEAFAAEVASLKRELARRPGVGLSSRTAAVSGIQSDKPVTALDLPVLTDFPKRPFGQRGADKAKGKKP